MKTRFAAFAKAFVSPQMLVLAAVAVVNTHPALATPIAGVTSSGQDAAGAISTLASSWLLPVVTAIGGIAWLVGAVGHMFRPDKKEMFTTMTAIGVTGVVGAGGGLVMTHVMGALSYGGTGVLIH